VKPEKLGQKDISKIMNQVTGACPWRKQDIKYKKNELYIDVIESVNLLVSTEGKRLRADVSGVVQLKVFLSGMPECKLGLNDKILMEKESRVGRTSRSTGIAIDDFTFHQCVKLGKFDTDRTISFIPPDGEFELMKYRSTENIEIPFHITPIVKEHSKTRLEIKVAVKSTFKRDMFGTQVKIKIPTPKNTAVCKIYSQTGKAKYYPEVDAVVWKINRFPGDTKYILGADIELSSSVKTTKKAWSRPPISMEFQVAMFTSSGLHVRFLKVLEQKQQYQAIKWVRYLTQAGNYQYRI
jgi:AP-2 complex subunit mu-1